LLRGAFDRHDGVEVDTQGDSFFVVFSSPDQALHAAEEGCQALTAGQMRVRMGLHTGTPLLGAEGYVGMDVNLAARIAAAGHGGQILVSRQTRELGVDAIDLEDLGEHRLKDFDAPIWIYQVGSEQFPPLKTISNTNLPRPVSSFVGRIGELKDVMALVRGADRVVTLHGPGGSGKTRLAVEAATELVPEFRNGVFWVGLAAVRDPGLVIETIAKAIGSDNRLAEHIGQREMLLLLDNFEQVVDAATSVSALLATCANLRVLVTSRDLLRIQGEREFPVPPLAGHEAVELFGLRSGLEPSKTVAELCSRLDRLPLAVELAAARASVLTPAQMLERLGQSLDLLRAGRDADPRQQTLRATIAWSHDLLDGEERELFARLAVFRGGCTLDAAAKIVGASVDALQSLVDKSLLRHTNERFWQLETVREYASERLGDSGEESEVRRQHAAFFLDYAEEIDRIVTAGGSLVAPFGRLTAELDNVRSVLEWARDTGEDEILVRLTAALGDYLVVRNLAHDARTWFAAAAARTSVPPMQRLSVLGFARNRAIQDGDLARAEDLHEQYRVLAEASGDPEKIIGAISGSALLAKVKGDLASAERLLVAEHDAAAEHGFRERQAYTLINLGALNLETASFEASLQYSSSAAEILRESDEESGLTVALLNGGAARLALGDSAGAADSCREALAVAATIEATHRIAAAALILGAALVALREFERGAEFLAAGMSLCETLDMPPYDDDREQEVLDHAMSEARTALGDDVYADVWERGRATSPEDIVRLGAI
jgi:predicted ATPase